MKQTKKRVVFYLYYNLYYTDEMMTRDCLHKDHRHRAAALLCDASMNASFYSVIWLLFRSVKKIREKKGHRLFGCHYSARPRLM